MRRIATLGLVLVCLGTAACGSDDGGDDNQITRIDGPAQVDLDVDVSPAGNEDPNGG